MYAHSEKHFYYAGAVIALFIRFSLSLSVFYTRRPVLNILLFD